MQTRQRSRPPTSSNSGKVVSNAPRAVSLSISFISSDKLTKSYIIPLSALNPETANEPMSYEDLEQRSKITTDSPHTVVKQLLDNHWSNNNLGQAAKTTLGVDTSKLILHGIYVRTYPLNKDRRLRELDTDAWSTVLNDAKTQDDPDAVIIPIVFIYNSASMKQLQTNQSQSSQESNDQESNDLSTDESEEDEINLQPQLILRVKVAQRSVFKDKDPDDEESIAAFRTTKNPDAILEDDEIIEGVFDVSDCFNFETKKWITSRLHLVLRGDGRQNNNDPEGIRNWAWNIFDENTDARPPTMASMYVHKSRRDFVPCLSASALARLLGNPLNASFKWQKATMVVEDEDEDDSDEEDKIPSIVERSVEGRKKTLMVGFGAATEKNRRDSTESINLPNEDNDGPFFPPKSIPTKQKGNRLSKNIKTSQANNLKATILKKVGEMYEDETSWLHHKVNSQQGNYSKYKRQQKEKKKNKFIDFFFSFFFYNFFNLFL